MGVQVDLDDGSSKKKKCSWFLDKDYCDDSGVRAACPVSCDSCDDDGETGNETDDEGTGNETDDEDTCEDADGKVQVDLDDGSSKKKNVVGFWTKIIVMIVVFEQHVPCHVIAVMMMVKLVMKLMTKELVMKLMMKIHVKMQMARYKLI